MLITMLGSVPVYLEVYLECLFLSYLPMDDL